MKKYLVPVALGAAGVLVAGLAMHYGRQFNIPLIAEAHDGFDS